MTDTHKRKQEAKVWCPEGPPPGLMGVECEDGGRDVSEEYRKQEDMLWVRTFEEQFEHVDWFGIPDEKARKMAARPASVTPPPPPPLAPKGMGRSTDKIQRGRTGENAPWIRRRPTGG